MWLRALLVVAGAAIAVAVVVVVLAAGEDDGGGAAAVDLRIAFDPGDGPAREATLACDDGSARATGYLAGADAAALCARVRDLRELLREPPGDRFCTQIFGGPQTARVRGRVGDLRVDRRFGRADGCEIAEWDRLARAGLVPAADG